MESKKISVAIPTYDSSKYLRGLLRKFVICESVNEIIIGNDFTNFEEENLLQSIVSDFSKKNPETNIVFLNNKKRLGPFLNKYNTIKHCSNEIVYQIDSDNLPMKNFDSFVTKDILKKFNKENIYYPSKI